MKTDKTKKWYRKTWVIIASLFVFFPLGLFLVWKSNWLKKSKIIVTATTLLAATSLGTYGFLNTPPSVQVNNLPSSKSNIEDAQFRLTGNVFPYSSKLVVDGKNIETNSKDGTFETTLDLSEGKNTFSFVVIKGDKKTEKQFSIYRLTSAEIAQRKQREEAEQQAKAEQERQSADAKKHEQQKQASQVQSQQKTKSESKEKTQTTMDKLWVASDEVIKTRNGVDIKFDKYIGTAQLYVTKKDYWNEKDLVGTAYRDFVQWGQRINGYDGVITIDVFIKANATDSRGNESTDTAVRVTMDSSKFRPYNWSNLKGKPIHGQLQSDGSLYLAPAIKSKVNLNGVKLVY